MWTSWLAIDNDSRTGADTAPLPPSPFSLTEGSTGANSCTPFQLNYKYPHLCHSCLVSVYWSDDFCCYRRRRLVIQSLVGATLRRWRHRLASWHISIFPHFWTTIFIFWREIDEKQRKRRFTSGFFLGGGNFFFFFYADAAREMASRVRKPLEASPVWIFFFFSARLAARHKSLD